MRGGPNAESAQWQGSAVLPCGRNGENNPAAPFLRGAPSPISGKRAGAGKDSAQDKRKSSERCVCISRSFVHEPRFLQSFDSPGHGPTARCAVPRLARLETRVRPQKGSASGRCFALPASLPPGIWSRRVYSPTAWKDTCHRHPTAARLSFSPHFPDIWQARRRPRSPCRRRCRPACPPLSSLLPGGKGIFLENSDNFIINVFRISEQGPRLYPEFCKSPGLRPPFRLFRLLRQKDRPFGPYPRKFPERRFQSAPGDRLG